MKRLPAAFLLCCVFTLPVRAEYPKIAELGKTDLFFRQLQQDIRAFNLAAARGLSPPPLTLYRYRTTDGDEVFSLAARLNIPYDTLVSLNAIPHPGPIRPGTELLVPSIPGIFVPKSAGTDMEYLMHSWRLGGEPHGTYLIATGNGPREFYFFPDARFHPVERAYFLGILFRFPLPAGIVTSEFGERQHPITGRTEFHNGIDLAAPAGTDVYAAADGIVTETGYSEVYGNFVGLAHFGGYSTIYGHLSKVLIQLHQKVSPGTVLGAVGNTGISTGPHLHFEIRSGGGPENPLIFFREEGDE